MFLRGLLESGYEGEIYPVNPKATEISGLKSYPNVKDIPGPVDHVISLIPAHLTPQLIEDCGAKGVKTVHLFTAGFSESGEEEGARLEAELADIGRRVGVRVLGPNCMGIHCPKARLAFNIGFTRESKESGTIGFISQSGGHAVTAAEVGPVRGLRFSKIISYGNACDLDETELLEYLTHDPDTEVIAAYLEGVKDGPRFQRVLREAAQAKPVIVFKGGRTEAGTRAVSSHTGALAGSETIWDSLLKQAGVIRVYTLDELIDLLVAFSYMPPIRARNVGVIGVGGGASVEAADVCESAGLRVPLLPLEIRREIREFTPLAGSSVRNPVDTLEIWSPEAFSRTIELVAGWEGIDFLIIHLAVETNINRPEGRALLDAMIDSIITMRGRTGKPIAVVLRSSGIRLGLEVLCDVQQRCLEAGLPVFSSVDRAALAVSRFIQYHEGCLSARSA
jgi:acyl-CoA synthetase (NDP forming)